MYLFEELRPGGCKGENLEAGRPHSSVAKLRRKWRPEAAWLYAACQGYARHPRPWAEGDSAGQTRPHLPGVPSGEKGGSQVMPAGVCARSPPAIQGSWGGRGLHPALGRVGAEGLWPPPTLGGGGAVAPS